MISETWTPHDEFCNFFSLSIILPMGIQIYFQIFYTFLTDYYKFPWNWFSKKKIATKYLSAIFPIKKQQEFYFPSKIFWLLLYIKNILITQCEWSKKSVFVHIYFKKSMLLKKQKMKEGILHSNTRVYSFFATTIF